MSLIESIAKMVTGITGVMSEKMRKEGELQVSVEKQLESLRKSLSDALSSGRICDASYFAKQIHQLFDKHCDILSCILAAMVFMVGCASNSIKEFDMPPSVIGERIRVVSPGETIVVPKYFTRASKWYLVDDVGLLQWLGLDMNSPGNK